MESADLPTTFLNFSIFALKSDPESFRYTYSIAWKNLQNESSQNAFITKGEPQVQKRWNIFENGAVSAGVVGIWGFSGILIRTNAEQGDFNANVLL